MAIHTGIMAMLAILLTKHFSCRLLSKKSHYAAALFPPNQDINFLNAKSSVALSDWPELYTAVDAEGPA